MLEFAVVFFALAALTSSIVAVLPRIVRARFWLGLPAAMAAIALATAAAIYITGNVHEAEVLAVAAFVAAVLLRILLRRWSFMAAQLFVVLVLASVTYLVYAVIVAAFDPLGPIAWIGSAVLTLLEAFALALGLSYAFEILDVLGRRDYPLPRPPPGYQPFVVLQVPTYNEPVEIVGRTLASLDKLDYPGLLVQVVDNNTEDPAVWRPLEQVCRELGTRFTFLHLENWPGYKAGALNEATRRLPPEAEVVGIVDADYAVEPQWLRAVAGYFADPRVAFVQTPQNYRDWGDDRYLRGLFYSYKYFFDLTMPARAHRNAIIFAGTMGLIRRSALEQIGGWNPDTVTEDAEASLRMLGAGYSGVYVPAPYGQGLMPLTFDGLKKQRFRWALGGIQILRTHWRELLPFTRHRLRLTAAQRIHYLLGSVQWFGDLLIAVFTVLLLITAAAAFFQHRLPVREISGPAVLVPLVFLVSGVGRALWALRVRSATNWGDAFRALRVWFALSWVVTLACLRGLISRQAAFLRTPKKKAGRATILQALRSSLAESSLTGLALLAAVVMIVATPSIATAILAILLFYLAAVYSSAIWASTAAEGIKLTPFRRLYLRSAQNTGQRPEVRGRPRLLPAGLIAAAAVAIGLILMSSTAVQNPQPQPLPPIVQQPGTTQPLPLNPFPTPSTSPSPTTTASAPQTTPSSTTRPSSTPTATPLPVPSSSLPPSTPRTTPTVTARRASHLAHQQH
jgi:cellulose synthase/poly-beta-1,6-N-acetylglucosamine synthase-like glycosyltransferase